MKLVTIEDLIAFSDGGWRFKLMEKQFLIDHPDVIVGSSFYYRIGSLIANGLSLEEAYKKAKNLK